MESISVGKTYARKNKYSLSADRELLAVGVGNFMGGLFQGYPVAGGFSRTAVNAQAGARTPVAALITALVVALSLLFLTPLFYYMPKAVLAAIIVTAVVGLVDLKEVEHLQKVKKADLALLLLTFAATLGLGIVQGIGVGVGASLLWFVYKTTRPHLAILGRVPGTQLFRNVARQKGLITYEGVLIVRMDAQFYFGNVSYLREALEEGEGRMRAPLRAVVLDASAINQLDSSAESALDDMWESYRARGVDFLLASVKGPVRDVLDCSGLAERMGAMGRCLSVTEALALIRALPESAEDGDKRSVAPPSAGGRASQASARL
jgi:SulP family sulfate permease